MPLSGPKAKFLLVTKGKDAHFLSRHHKAIEGDIAGSPVGNDQFAQIARDASPDQRMCGKIIDGGLDGCHRIDGSFRLLVVQKPESALDLRQ